jgi:hypothetical protein
VPLPYAGQSPHSGSPAFVIGAHVQSAADLLLICNRGFYRSYFAGPKVLDRRRNGVLVLNMIKYIALSRSAAV